ncbi:MAG TPA: dihydrodipicolinate synthase family protein [Clostridia bacterium]|nr:dihydrodipicolinate synthase family protein [Clostridia bacterium]
MEKAMFDGIKNKLQGVFCPLTTPFDDDGRLNTSKLEKNMARYAASPVNGYLILGSNGENKSLRTEEKLRVVRTAVAGKGKNQTTMIASIFESTEETIEFAKAAEELGADFITLLPPSYFKKAMTDEVLIRYFTDVASAVHTPCLLYHAPQFSGTVTFSSRVVEECAKHPNIAGMKDSSGDIQKHLLNDYGSSFAIMSGSANTFMESMLLGATGGVISLADCVPEAVSLLYRLIVEKNYEEAIELNRRIISANQKISGKYGVAGVKAAMDICGMAGGIPRLPLLPLKTQDIENIRSAVGALV